MGHPLAQPLTDAQRALAETCFAVAIRTANRASRRPFNAVDRDDFHSDALLGLIYAARTFDPDKGLKFSTYAGHRARSAIADGKRDRDPLSRADRRKGMYRPAFIELSENHVEPARRPPDFVQRDAIDTILGRGFPERQRHILMRLFVDGADNAQIGVELGISANAVSQQRMYAIQRLKARYLRANNPTCGCGSLPSSPSR